MKKIIILLILVVFMITLTSCSEEIKANNYDLTYNVKYIHSDYIDLEVVESGGGYVIAYDTHTKVLYIITDGYNCGAMSPIYNKDGSLKLYQGD